MQDLFATLLQAIITVSTPIVAAFVVQWLNLKSEQIKTETELGKAEKYLNQALEAAANAVLYTFQTYVDGLKASDKWDTMTQKEALNKAIAKAKSLLTKDAIEFITMAYGDVNNYLTTLIEAEIKFSK